MSLTRRSRRFAELAELIDDYCSTMGLDIPAPVVDQLLNERVEDVADRRSITGRSALGHLRDSDAASVARSLVRTARKVYGVPEQRGAHLRALPSPRG